MSLLLLLALVVGLFPVLGIPSVSAANLSTDIYQLPSKTLNDAGTNYRQNMSYIIRTRNGKIIVIDGGYSTDNLDANYLISQLKSITGKDVPNVDAWFFTHNHGDHVGAFKAIAARMPTKVTVDTVYYRFPTDAEVDKYAPEADRETLKTSNQSFRNHVKLMKKADGTPTDTVTLAARYKNTCNGVFTIDTVQIDVLMTCAEVFWGCDNITAKYSGSLSTNGKAYTNQTIKQLVNADFGNNTTSVFRMTTMGQSVLFLGDAAEPEGLMLKYFHDKNTENSNNYFSLKSDIVQMAHHGQNAVPKSVYVAIDPDIALWPAPDWVYNPSSSSSLTTEYTKKWMKELGTTNYVSKDGLKKISLSDLRTPDVKCAIPEELKPLVFDPVYYGNRYPDVVKALGNDAEALYNHFLKYGLEEGRCASPYFDIKYYMSQNSLKMSVHCKGNYEKGMDHFIKFAYEEGELTGGGAKKLSPTFDCKYYYNNYPVLKELGLKNEFEILQYFVTTGQAAGHKGAAEVVTLNGGIVYHTVSKIAAVAPTCTTAGKTAGTKCATCALVLTAQTTVAAKGHSYNAVVTAPTCTEAGFTTYTCSVCKDSYQDSQIAATGHSYRAVVTAPTCTEAGFTTYTCTTCSHSYIGDEVTPSGHSYKATVTPPTCTEAGYTAYVCRHCNDSYIGDRTEATGHSYVTTVTPPTCTEAGYSTHTCSACHYVYWDNRTEATGHSYSYSGAEKEHTATCHCGHVYTEVHSYVDGLCICGQLEIKEPVLNASWKMGHTLNLASDISVNFAVSKSLLTGFDMDTVYVLAEIDTYDGNTKTGTKTVKLLPAEQENYYYFTLTGLTAVHMNDRIRSVLYGTKDGQPYCSATDDYSIADYAYSQMNKANMPNSLKILCADLLRYGAKAQIYKSYRTDKLADSAMTDAHKAYLSHLDAVTFGNTNTVLSDLPGASITWAGKALDLNSKVTLKFIFALGSYAGSAEALRLKVSYENYAGQEQTLYLTGAELYNADRGYYAFSFDGLLAAELRSPVSVRVYAGDTPISCTLRYSADTYGNNKTGSLLDLCKALCAYSDSAKAYFVN